MQIFKNRADPKYIEALEAALNLDGPLGLEATALDIPNPKRDRTNKDLFYNRAVCIDYVGFSATTLFDRGKRCVKKCFFEELEELVRNTESLNRKGIIVKIRVLLLYPYSAAALTRIQAEISQDRAAIENPCHSRGMDFLEQVTKDSMHESESYLAQKRTVKIFHEWLRELGGKHAVRHYPNMLDLRFASVNPLFCGLRVNHRFWYDSYTYGKRNRHQNVSPGDIAPLIEIECCEGEPYLFFYDHFRYVWECDATLEMEDALRWNDGTVDILTPDTVRFTAKAKRLSHRVTPPASDDQRYDYEVKGARILQRHCPLLRPTDAAEVVFIACSWKPKGNAPHTPNADAEKLQVLLHRDFGPSNPFFKKARLGVRLLVGTPGQDLAPLLYGALEDSTLGIVILSPDIRVGGGTRDHISRPNVYHELGYLMAKNTRKRIFMFLEKRVPAPSNVGGLVRIDYQEDKIDLKYVELLKSLLELHLLTQDEAYRVAQSCLKEFEKDVLMKKKTADEYNWAKTLVHKFLKPSLHARP